METFSPPVTRPLRLETPLPESGPYFLGHGSLPHMDEALRGHSFDRLFLITDEPVHGLYGRVLQQRLLEHGWDARVVIVAAGEACKSVSVLGTTCEQLLQNGVTKDSILIALGGGALGNLVGLSASLIFRGIRFVHVPTTFMAQTDSTLSRKQAVNSSTSKNILGTYHGALFVWADSATLFSESAHALRSAMVETIKNAFISDPALLSYVDASIDSVVRKAPEALHEFVHRSIVSKLKILQRDPSERCAAVALEYGHTFGHALERLSAGQLTHGHAVAMGMMLAARVSRRLGMLDDAGVETHRYYLAERLCLSLEIPSGISTAAILAAMNADNKRSASGTQYVLLKSMGTPLNAGGDCLTNVDAAIIRSVLDEQR